MNGSNFSSNGSNKMQTSFKPVLLNGSKKKYVRVLNPFKWI